MNNAKYDVIDLSKYIISLCSSEESPITNLQLQKILYYIQKDFLARKELAFKDDIEAWQFGPVVPKVYYHFCGSGAMPIDKTYDIEMLPDETIEKIVREKRELNPWDMVAETHKPNGAWAKTYNNGKGNHMVIPTDLIKSVG